MDLGDFVPEKYEIRFSIEGRPYEVRYQEACVDEVLELLSQAEEGTKASKELAERRRRYVTDLFARNLTTGDPVQLESDLKLVPYVSFRGSLDIFSLYTLTQSRVKKNSELGVIPLPTKGLRGFLGRLLSSSKPAKAV
ncbi:MAG: hypothetical protein JWP89_2642 [Schlesneria sp.]|nr:hypothetical protein [Schlesneria sp.]